jgi:peptide/nickel transport system permease protein/oligopeptide transport system permease protein
MQGLVVRRILGAVATFFVATAVVFVLTFALPGDPARTIAGRKQVPESTLAAIRARYDLDEPLLVQYVGWVGRLLRGDLGESFVQRREVRDVLLDAAPVTLTLVGLAVMIEIVVGLVVGTSAGMRRGRWLDNSVTGLSTLALAAPLFIVASLAQEWFGVRWRLLPVAGVEDGLVSYVLPALTLSLAGAAVAVRLSRAETLEQSSAQHVRVAHGKGLRAGAVTRNHIVRNSLPPFVAFVGLEIGALAGGSVVVGRIYNLPGVGRAVAAAISQRDNALIIGFTMEIVIVYLVIDLVVDVAVMWLDPRIRAGRS